MISGSPFAMLSFILVTTFTPGPANISSASMGILYGYRNSLRFLAGLATAVFLMMLFSGLVSTAPICPPQMKRSSKFLFWRTPSEFTDSDTPSTMA